MGNFRNILVGRTGEDIAKEYIKKQGFKIIESNWHYSKNSEIDIIALDKDTIVFIEVKTRTTKNFGHPLEAINKRKIEKIYSAALAYQNINEVRHKDIRIDAISIIDLKNPKIEHIKNISLD